MFVMTIVIKTAAFT